MRVRTKDILNAVNKLSGFVVKKSSIPALQSVLLVSENDQLFLTTTKLRQGQTQIVAAPTESPINIAVNYTKLLKLLKAWKGSEITIKQEDDKLVLSHKDLTASVEMHCVDYPVVLAPTAFGEFSDLPKDELVRGSYLIDRWTKAVLTVSTAEDRPYLNQVLFTKEKDHVSMISISGSALSKLRFDCDPHVFDDDFGASGEFLKTATKVISKNKYYDVDVGTFMGKHTLCVRSDDQFLWCVNSEDCDAFPPYQRLIPSSFDYTTILARRKLMNFALVVKKMAEQVHRPLEIKFMDDHLELASGRHEEHSIKQTFDYIVVPSVPVETRAVDAGYLFDGLAVIDSADVECSFRADGLGPIRLALTTEPVDIFILMPLRL